MPWSVQRAGLAAALLLMILVSTLAVYTAYRLLAVQFIHGRYLPTYLLNIIPLKISCYKMYGQK